MTNVHHFLADGQFDLASSQSIFTYVSIAWDVLDHFGNVMDWQSCFGKGAWKMKSSSKRVSKNWRKVDWTCLLLASPTIVSNIFPFEEVSEALANRDFEKEVSITVPFNLGAESNEEINNVNSHWIDTSKLMISNCVIISKEVVRCMLESLYLQTRAKPERITAEVKRGTTNVWIIIELAVEFVCIYFISLKSAKNISCCSPYTLTSCSETILHLCQR